MDVVVNMATRDLESAFADGILQNMGDGVLILGANGKIVATNKAAATILGPEIAEDDFTLARIALEEIRNDTFMQILIDSLFEGVTIHNRIVPFVRTDGTECILSVTASHLRNDVGKLDGVFIVVSDMTEVEELRESREGLTQELQEALRVADEKTRELESALSYGQKIRNGLTVAVLVFFVGIGVYHWMDTSSVSATSDQHTSAVSDETETLTVTTRPLIRSISLSGIVAPLEEFVLTAPFQGRVKEKLFFYGDQVKRGQTLAILDTTEMESKLRDARAEFIKAKKKSLELEEWDKTPEVAKARRDLSQAKNQLTKAESKVDEDKVLLDEGIIPRSEYESSLQDLRDKKMQYISNRENLKSVMDKGDDEYREIGRMELKNAEAKMRAVETKITRATIVAPVSGIAIRPAATEKDAKNITSGMVVNEGRALLSIGSIEGLSITTEVDELDINNLETGQAVIVSGDAFPGVRLKGRIAQLSSQANDGQIPTFTATIRLRDLPEGVERKVRLGMTANMQVEIYSNPTAIMVPLSSVIHSNGSDVVLVVDEGGAVRELEVETGHTTLSDVEILSGIEKGAVILMAPAQ